MKAFTICSCFCSPFSCKITSNFYLSELFSSLGCSSFNLLHECPQFLQRQTGMCVGGNSTARTAGAPTAPTSGASKLDVAIQKFFLAKILVGFLWRVWAFFNQKPIYIYILFSRKSLTKRFPLQDFASLQTLLRYFTCPREGHSTAALALTSQLGCAARGALVCLGFVQHCKRSAERATQYSAGCLFEGQLLGPGI